MLLSVAILLLLSIAGFGSLSEEPQFDYDVFHFIDTFDENSVLEKWHHSTFKETEHDAALMYQGEFSIGPEKENSTNNALLMDNPENFNRFGIFRMFDKPFYFKDTLIVQYELAFKNVHQCGGAYLKLLSKDSGISKSNNDLNSETPYTIMFGPDVCNSDYKFHFIFCHKNPITGEIEEKHMKQPDPSKYKHIFTDGKVHLLRLMTFKWGQRYVIELDNYVIAKGSLRKDFIPSVNPEEYLDDETDVKPSDWDDLKFMFDPNDTKPDDWDETEPQYIEDSDATIPDDWNGDASLYIDDETAEIPSEWNDEIDGEWLPPKIPNPLCMDGSCGPWTPPTIKNPKYRGMFNPKMVSNPNYKGEFKPKQIKNPHFFNDENPFEMTPIEAVAIEVVASPNIVTFDNIVITNKADALMVFNSKHWKSKNAFNAKAVFNQYKMPIIIGGLVVGSVIFVILVVLKYSSPKEVVKVETTADDEKLLEEKLHKSESDEEKKPSEEENETEEDADEEPKRMLRRSTRKPKKIIS